jgi:dipeptide/tripeptide permease
MALERIMMGLVSVGWMAASAAAGLGYILPAAMYFLACTMVVLIAMRKQDATMRQRYARMVELAQYITELRQEIVERRLVTSEKTAMVEILDHGNLEGAR